tara:strand:- start:1475 stop:1723 length:249 start_codon:yes stop_codon:yes gene_type:complete
MTQKGKRGKPTRKEIDVAIKNLVKSIQYIGQKIEYLEQFSKSTDMALDLYIEFKKDKKEFTKHIEEFQKNYEKEVAKEEKTS